MGIPQIILLSLIGLQLLINSSDKKSLQKG